MSTKREVRFLKNTIELRIDGDKNVISGYASVFSPARSEDLGGFIEQVDAHAFDESISGDVRGLFNHDANQILGRTKSGNLRLSTDSRGLRYEIDVPDTQLGRDLVTSMKRGDVDSSSFAFRCIKDAWEQDDNGMMLRTILKADLFDVSPVVYPAYPDASSQVRSLFPEGKPEIPTLDERKKKDEDDDDDYDEDRCECSCDSCMSKNCEACDVPDCADENCRCNKRSKLTDSEKRRLEMRAEMLRYGVVVRADENRPK